MRGTSPAIVFAIGPSGEVVRKIQVDPGDSRMRALDIQASPGRLAILCRGWWGGTSEAVLQVIDLSGNAVASYSSEDGVPWGSLACYKDPVFTFLGTTDGSAVGPI